jgi:hypothetical protein
MMQAQRSEVVCKHCKEACWLKENPCEDPGEAAACGMYMWGRISCERIS